MNDLYITTDCKPPKGPTIELAGKMVGIDLQNPIDLSQMMVGAVSADPKIHGNHGEYYFTRRSELFAYVFNEFGEREELSITFELKSQRIPDYIRNSKSNG